jgi:CO/xanthine dehydrogenase Mo-binding subunit
LTVSSHPIYVEAVQTTPPRAKGPPAPPGPRSEERGTSERTTREGGASKGGPEASGEENIEYGVNLETGIVTVLRTSTVADAGQAINPQLVARQDEGATLQGIGNALFEEMHCAPDGMLLNDTLLSYRVPAFRDIPAAMRCSIVENGDGPRAAARRRGLSGLPVPPGRRPRPPGPR